MSIALIQTPIANTIDRDPYSPWNPHAYSYEAASMRASGKARRMLLLCAARHWRTVARDLGFLIRSYNGKPCPHDAAQAARALEYGRRAIAALRSA